MDPMWDDTLGGPTPVYNSKLHSSGGSGAFLWGSTLSPPGSTSSSPCEDSPISAALRRQSADYARSGRPPLYHSASAVEKPSPPSAAKPSSLPSLDLSLIERTASLPSAFSGSPFSPGIVSPAGARSGQGQQRENVWRSVFHPGSNKAGMDRLSATAKIDIADPKGPSVYDWMYNGRTKSDYR